MRLPNCSIARVGLAVLALGAGLAACGSRDPTDPRVRSAPSPSAYPSGTTLPPGVSHVDRVEHYEIAGDDAAEVWRQMRERAPMIRGRVVTGRTDWDVRWTYRTPSRPTAHAGWCRPTDVRVAATITIILPAFTPPDSASALARDWAAYVADLERHERGHRRIVLEGLSEVRRAIQDAQASSCGTLASEVNARGRAALARIAARSEAYDREESRDPQRVRWPPRPASPAPPPR